MQDPTDPQSFNRYAYARNNPIIFVDPTGNFFWFAVAIIAVAAVAGGIANAIANRNNGRSFWQNFASGAAKAALAATAVIAVAAVAVYALATASAFLASASPSITIAGAGAGSVTAEVSIVTATTVVGGGITWGEVLAGFAIGAGIAASLNQGQITKTLDPNSQTHNIHYAESAESVSQNQTSKNQPSRRTDQDAPSDSVEEGVYEFPDATAGGKPYVGQSKNVQRRLDQHKRSGKLKDDVNVKVDEVKGGKTAREIEEHKRIQQHTRGQPAKESEAVSNKKDPIGAKRTNLLG